MTTSHIPRTTPPPPSYAPSVPSAAVPGVLGIREDGPVLRVDLNPAGGDTLGIAAVDQLNTLIDHLHDRPGVRVLVLSSSGDDFCLGADRAEYRAVIAADPTGASLRRAVDTARRLCQALESTHAVTIARLHGGVVGAGLALASFCDLRVGADDCRFRMPEVAVGLAPAWGGALGRLIAEAGAARIRELMLTCDSFDAVTAQRIGLLHKVTPRDMLDEAVDDWTRPIVRRSAEALALTKNMFAGHARAHRTADTSLLDAHLLTAQLAR
ncbi:enoyl-CoA hydratase/isomerase family protein [Streptomyces sp. NPDC058953]|uniref:enoyl-CoA hydratase/isomerase family protein n=1 Tax=unclassified Streptomyces TaxID=2593676 RepID=UPI0036842FE3